MTNSSFHVYPRDYSGLDSPGRGSGRLHASRLRNDGKDMGVAACNENILLVLEEPSQFLECSESVLCRSAACKKVFATQQRGRKTGKPDRRKEPPGTDRRAQRRRRRDEVNLRVHRANETRERAEWARAIKRWPTHKLILSLVDRDQTSWFLTMIEDELDARLPPRSKP